MAAGSVKRTAGLETQLQGLLPHTTYMVRVRALTGAGEGVPSAPLSCTTHEDGERHKQHYTDYQI